MSEGLRLVAVFAFSLLAALALTIVPLAEPVQGMRPAWVALVIIYWLLSEPQRFGMLTAWICGLLLDVNSGVWLGQHALALAVVAYLTQRFHLRLRVFPIGQQTLTVLMMIASYEFLLFWVDGITSQDTGGWHRWLGVVISAACWPLVRLALDHARVRFADAEEA